MPKTPRRFWAILVIVAVIAGGGTAYSIVRRGLSTRTPPSGVEELMALTMRRLATPAAARNRSNPVPFSDAVFDGALAHFADHCASCHANDGSGQTEMGRSFYPPVPDMRASRTQSLTDGELFSIIENGIRLTGMPAWGTGTEAGEAESWALVHFIRRLPRLTPEQIEQMEGLNPKSPEVFRQEEEIRRFMAGEEPSPAKLMPGMKPGMKHEKH